MKNDKYEIFRNRIYLPNEPTHIRYWKTGELCRYLGMERLDDKMAIRKAAELYVEWADRYGIERKYVRLMKKALLFRTIGEGIFEDAYIGLAGEIILTHPLKSLSEKENRVLAAAISLLQLPDAADEDSGKFLKRMCPDKKGRKAALLISRAVRQTGTSADRVRKDFHSTMQNYICHQISTVEELSARGQFSDADVVHDIRVAFRRLMSLCSVFPSYLDNEWVRTFYSEFQGALKALGRARDLDVMAEKINVYLQAEQKGTAEIPGLTAWIVNEKRKCSELSAEYFVSSEYADFISTLQASLKKPICRPVLKGGCDPVLLPPRRIYHHFLSQTLVHARAYEEWIIGSLIPEPLLHHLRLVYKDMRFILEFFHEFLGDEELMMLEHCKKIQDALGNLHDYSVIIRKIEKIMLQKKKEIKISAAEQKILNSFIIYSKSEQETCYRQYLELRRK